MKNEKEYSGSCFCGAVKFTVLGSPKLQGYCHCESCRTWSASPINGFTLWDPADVKVIEGSEHVASFQKTETSKRSWCKLCGGHVFTHHPSMALTDIYSAIIPSFPFEPSLHVHYQETVLHIHDHLPKMKDLPKEAGGSGELLAE